MNTHILSKKGILIIGLILALGFITLIAWILRGQQEKVSPTIAQTQEVAEHKVETKRELPLNPERLRQLEELQQIHTIYENAYEEHLARALHNSNIVLSDETRKAIESVLASDIYSLSDILSILRDEHNISLSPMDAEKLVEAYRVEREEAQVHQARLEILKERNIEDAVQSELALIRLILETELSSQTSLTREERGRVSEVIMTRLGQNNNYYNAEISEKSELLRSALEFGLSRFTQLEPTVRQTVSESILGELQNLGILPSPQVGNSETGFIKNILLSTAHADNTDAENYRTLIRDSISYISYILDTGEEKGETISTQRRTTLQQIINLQIDIYTDLTISRILELELSFARGDITPVMYNTQKDTYYSELESVLILKNEEGNISLSEIEYFQLANYQDDSEEIATLTPLAYIQSKTGYVFVKNLRGSYKLGASNMLLYPGYEIITRDDSETQLIFADESLLRLEANSRVVLSGDLSTITASVESGSIWARIVKPFAGQSFVIQDSGVSLGVRGTSLYLSKTSGELYIVDSHSDDAGVVVNGTSQVLQAGQKVLLTEDGIGVPEDFIRSNLIDEKRQIGDFIRSDLRQLSLLLDDKKRGFHNNPLSNSNGDANYLERLEAEITNSLPQGVEKERIFQSSEIRGTGDAAITPESIYSLTLKDQLIAELDASTSSNKASKKNAIRDTNFQSLETELGSKRSVERRYELGLVRDIINTTTITSAGLENMIRDFPVPVRETEREILEAAALKLGETLNGGSRMMRGSFDISSSIDHDSEIIILSDWEVNNVPSIYSEQQLSSSPFTRINGYTVERLLNTRRAGEVILSVTLTLNQQSITRDYAFELPVVPPSAVDELRDVANIYIDHLRGQQRLFTHTMFRGGVTQIFAQAPFSPIISFTGGNILADGTIIRPEFDNYTHEFQGQRYKKIYPTITFTHPLDSTISLATGTSELPWSDNWVYIKNKTQEVCTGIEIQGECYTLIAESQYTDTSIGTVADRLQLKRYGEGYNIRAMFSSSITLSDQGVTVTKEKNDILSYNLQSLQLGDDWAIEMSVRGEDLNRLSPGFAYVLFSIPGMDNGTRLWFESNNINFKIGNNPTIIKPISYLGLNNSGYQKIILQKDSFGISSPINLGNKLYVGSRVDGTRQWDSVINFIKIYKKKS